MPFKFNPISNEFDYYESADPSTVLGPASAVDDNLAAFDGTTGKLIKDSGVATTDVVQSSATLTQYAVVCGDSASKNVQTIASVGNAGEVLTSNGAGALPSFQSASGGLAGLRNTSEVFDDLIWTGAASVGLSTLNWINNVSGGTISYLQGISGHPGVYRLSSTAGATNRSELVLNATSSVLLFGDGEYTIEWMVRVPKLSDATNEFRVGVGFNGSVGGAPSNGVLFTYTHSVNSGNWTIEADDVAGTTTADSGTAVVAGTWYRLGIVVNAAATSVAYYINGVETSNSPLTTNIPDGATEYTQPLSYIKNLAGVAADRHLDLDYCYMKIALTSTRA